MNEKLLKAIETFAASRQAKSKNVYLLNDIDSKLLELHKKRYAEIGSDEKPLLAVNKSIPGTVGGYGWSGLLITDKNVYYRCVKDTFWASLVASSNKGTIPLEQVVSIRIGAHDHCFGTAYIGHQLLINNNNVGLLRMGGSMEYDDKAIDELNQIFSNI